MFGSAGVRARARAFDSREEGARGSERTELRKSRTRLLLYDEATSSLRLPRPWWQRGLRGEEGRAQGPGRVGGTARGVEILRRGSVTNSIRWEGREGRLEGWLRDRLAGSRCPGPWRGLQNIPTAVVVFVFFFSPPRTSFPLRGEKNGRRDRVSFRNDCRMDGFVETWTTGWLTGWSVYSWW